MGFAAVAARVPSLWTVRRDIGMSWFFRGYLGAGAALIALGYAHLTPLTPSILEIAMPIAGGAVMACHVAAWRPERSRAWLSLALSMVATGAGAGTWWALTGGAARADMPFVSGLFYVAAHSAMIGALWALTWKRAPDRDGTTRIDSAIIALGLGLAAWVALVDPIMSQVGATFMSAATAVAAPVFDLTLMVLIARALLIRYRRSTSMNVILAGMSAVVVGDCVYARLAFSGAYASNGPLELTWLLGCLCVSASVLHPSSSWLAMPSIGGESPAMSRRRGAAIGAACLVGPLLLLWSWYRGETHNLPVIAVAATGIMLLWMKRSALYTDRIRSSADERKALEGQLADTERRDPLVGLLNHAAFQARVEQVLSDDGDAAVLYLDIDDFKNINDTLGRKTGDDVLVETAHRIRGILRARDEAARLGSDEFGILLPGVGAAAAEEMAAHMLELLRSPIPVNSKLIRVTGSIGLAVGGPGASADDLARDAHVALYLAKNEGKNRFQLFCPSAHASVLARIALRSQLAEAISGGQFVLHYQPIVDVADRSTVACEALVRWQHPERGMIGPNEFIPLAEETGLIVGLGRWVMEEACREAAAWAAMFGERAPAISVNASGIQFRNASFPVEIAAAAAEAGLDPRSLIVELTESALIGMDGASGMLDTIRASGARIAIDDFGTGYSSLAYLARYPIDVLKIDRAFVQSIGTGTREDMLTSEIVNLVNHLGIQVLAEGVETIAQFERLAELDCGWIQGYLFSRPLPSDRVRAYIAASLGKAVAGASAAPAREVRDAA